MRVEKRINEVVNRLNKTKVERNTDLKGEYNSLASFVYITYKSKLMQGLFFLLFFYEGLKMRTRLSIIINVLCVLFPACATPDDAHIIVIH